MHSSGANKSDILVDYSSLFRIYKDGRLERLKVALPISPSLDPQTGVESKDVKLFLEMGMDTNTGIFTRLFKPNLRNNPTKIPLMVYIHGGGFCTESTFSPMYHHYLNSLSSQAQILIVSVEYRLAPEHPIPAAYNDCWHALNWVASHAMITDVDGHNNNIINLTTTTHCDHRTYNSTCNLGSHQCNINKEAWLLDHADFSRIFLAGDSAGANIAHQMSMRVGLEGLAGGIINKITGMVMFHPSFWGKTRIGDEVAKCSRLWAPDTADLTWTFVYPGVSNESDHPWMNPAKDSHLSRLGCERVLIFVSEKDFLRDRGVYYKEVLEKSGWQGKVEVVEFKGEGHVFHLLKPSCANALEVMSKVVAFLNPTPKGTRVLFEKLSWSRL